MHLTAVRPYVSLSVSLIQISSTLQTEKTWIEITIVDLHHFDSVFATCFLRIDIHSTPCSSHMFSSRPLFFAFFLTKSSTIFVLVRDALIHASSSHVVYLFFQKYRFAFLYKSRKCASLHFCLSLSTASFFKTNND